MPLEHNQKFNRTQFGFYQSGIRASIHGKMVAWRVEALEERFGTETEQLKATLRGLRKEAAIQFATLEQRRKQLERRHKQLGMTCKDYAYNHQRQQATCREPESTDKGWGLEWRRRGSSIREGDASGVEGLSDCEGDQGLGSEVAESKTHLMGMLPVARFLIGREVGDGTISKGVGRCGGGRKEIGENLWLSGAYGLRRSNGIGQMRTGYGGAQLEVDTSV